MKLKILVAIAAMASAMPAASETLQPSAKAFINWESFTFKLYALDGFGSTPPAIQWETDSQKSFVNANSNSGSSQDWVDPISAKDGVVKAAANGLQLVAEFTGMPADPKSNASVSRKGSFTLTSGSYVEFSVEATTYIYMDNPVNGEASALAWLKVGVPDDKNLGSGGREFGSISLASGLGDDPESDSTTLKATLTNTTSGTLYGTLTAFAEVNRIGSIPAIPEPRTYAMMLAGLGLLGFVARRRKLVVVPA